MNSSKKLFALILAVAMIVGMIGSVSAAGFSDLKDAKCEKAVTTLNGLDVIRGYEDGTFRPNNKITRAEFAAVAVRALGLESAAEAAKGASRFSDVKPEDWFAGYVNVAAERGIVLGHPDGTFAPNDNVTFAQALTMVVRMLGYTDDKVSGTWPTNYVVKASDLGLVKDVKVGNVNEDASRGDVSLFVYNALDVNTLQQHGYGDSIEWKDDGPTLLEKLEIETVEGVVTMIPRVSGNELGDAQLKIDDDTYDVIISDFDFDSVFGREVKAWVNDDDEIFKIDVKTKASDVAVDYVKDAEDTDLRDYQVELGAKGKVAFADDAVVYINGEDVDISADLDDGNDGIDAFNDLDFGTFVFKTGKVIFADVNQWDETSALVTEVDTKRGVVKFDGAPNVDVDDYDEVIVKRDGAAAELEDVEVGDVAYYWEDGDNLLYLYVVSTKVDGELTKVSRDDKIYIDGKSYSASGNLLFSDDEGDEIQDYDAPADLDALLGEEVTVSLGLDGKWVYVVGKGEGTGDTLYGVVVKTWTSDEDYIKIFKADGTTATYAFTADTTDNDGASVDERDFTEGDLVEFTLDSKGKLDTIDNTESVETNLTMAAVDDDDETISVGPNDGDDTNDDEVKYVSSKTLIVDITDPNDPELVDWADIAKADLVADADATAGAAADPNEVLVSVLAKTGGADVKILAITDGMDNITLETEIAVVLDKWYTSDGWMLSLDVFGEGEKEVLRDSGANPEVGDVITYKPNAAGEAASVAVVLAAQTTAGVVPADPALDWADAVAVNDVKTGFIDITGAFERVSSDALVYDATAVAAADYDDVDPDDFVKADFGDIEDGYEVVVYRDGTVIKAIIIIDIP